jgi:succinate-acetate transporter protein
MARVVTEQSTPVTAPATIANPAPLGLSGFAVTTFVLSANAAGFYKAPYIVLGLAVFYGGLMQIIAGIHAFRVGNTFACTAFCSYAAFWLSFAALFIPGFGVMAGYTSPKGAFQGADFDVALGIYMLAWAVFTAYVFVASFKTNWVLVTAFLLALLTFLAFGAAYLMLGNGMDGSLMLKIGGWLGIALAASAWYGAAAFLLAEMGSFNLPIGPLS